MAAIFDPDVPGFFAPVHRALTDPILMGGAPRTVAIANGTLAAAIAVGPRPWSAARRGARGGSWTWSPAPFVPQPFSASEAPMLNLAEYRSRPAGLADFLPW